jgi:hypothetical protein
MNQRLEQFVHDHREDFDADEPSKKVWDKICQDMEPPKQRKIVILRLTRTSLSVAAAALLVVALGFWYLGSRHASTTGTQDPGLAQTGVKKAPAGAGASKVETPGQSAIDTPQTAVDSQEQSGSPEDQRQLAVAQPKEDKANDQESIIHEEMQHYARLVELKHEELKSIKKDEPLLYKQFASEADKLDSVYHVLQQQLPNHPNKEQLLEAMLQNLQLQMGLLNHQLDIIKQINHSKQTAYEKAYKTI